jgi:aldose 1-epimerase
MPTTHTYFNLSGFKTSTVLEDTLHMPFATRSIACDSLKAPTGEFIDLKQDKGHLLNFTSPRRISENAPGGEFGSGGPGIDHAFVFDDSAPSDAVKLEWSSPATGIRLRLKTNQDGIQVYTATHHDGSAQVKDSQKGGESEKVEKFGCMAIEPQDYIDGINHPEWKRQDKQIFGPASLPLVNWSEYTFDTI